MNTSVHAFITLMTTNSRESRLEANQSTVPANSISAAAVILCKASVHYIDVICMHSAMLNDDTSSHRCVLWNVYPPANRPSDLSLVSSTICCTNSTLFPSSCPPRYCPTSVDASASSSSQDRGTFTRKEPSDSGTSWSSSSIFPSIWDHALFGAAKGPSLILDFVGLRKMTFMFTRTLLTLVAAYQPSRLHVLLLDLVIIMCLVWSSSRSRTSIRSRPQTHPKQPTPFGPHEPK
jgi:hypothetical protein